MTIINLINDSIFSNIYWFPWISFFSDTWVLQFFIIYNLYLMFLTVSVYYTLLYLFIEIMLFGIFISLYQMELFTGFLWVVEGTVIFIAIILLLYLNSEGLITSINLKIYKFFFVIGIFFFFLFFFDIYNFNNIEDISVVSILNYFDLYDDYYEAIFNRNANDFLVLFISYYSINNLEFILIGILLLLGSLVCVQLNKLQKNIKLENLTSYFTFYKFFNDILDFFFLRKQNLVNQTMHPSTLRIFKKK